MLDVDSPERLGHIRFLIESTEDGLDERMLALIDDQPLGVESVLCRVLAERRPDRDPTYVLDRFRRSKPGKSHPVDGWLRRLAYRNPLGVLYGIPRLRLASPVEHYARDVVSWRATRRLLAVLSLGDTADPVAVPHVVTALRDRKWGVRLEATNAIRRLVRDGAVGPQAVDAVADALVGCLSDRRLKVVEHAAAALSIHPLRERLIQERRSSGLTADAVAVVDAVLDGKRPPLEPTWAGDIGSANEKE